jgi:hypothetical protein
MPCPVCRSNNLWDDNLAWGCDDCDFFTTGGISNRISPADKFNQPRAPKPIKRVCDCREHGHHCTCHVPEVPF